MPQVWWLGPVGLSLFFWFLLEAESSARFIALAGLAFGTVTGAAAVVWFWNVLPLDFLEIRSATVQFAAVAMTWAYVALALGLPVGLFALLVRAFRSSCLFPAACAVLWTGTEIARMWSFALFTWAPQSLFGPHFSVASVGYVLAENHWLLQIAHPLGIDALNLLAAWMAGLVAMIPVAAKRANGQRPFFVQTLVLLSLVLLAAVGSKNSYNVPPRSLRVAVVHEHIREGSDPRSHEITAELLTGAAATFPPVDVVILPEEIGLTSIFWSKEDAQNFIGTRFGLRDVLIMNSRNELFPAEEQNLFPESKKLIFQSTARGEIGRYIKMMLMPLGEYAPVAAKPCFSLLGDQDLSLYVDDVSAFPVPRAQPVAFDFKGIHIGGLLCSDLLSPILYRQLVRDGKADVLVNLSNQFWFHGSHLLHWKTLQMAKVHAVQNRLPFLLANNLAPSFALDSTGRVRAQSAWCGRGVLYIDLPFAK